MKDFFPSAKFKLALFLIFAISAFSIKAEDCPQFERKVWSGESTKGKDVTLCWNTRSFTVLEEGSIPRVFPALAISLDENLIVYLNNLVGEEKTKKFKPTHQALLNEYLEGVGDRASHSMTGSVVGLMDMINRKELMGNIDCDPNKIFLNFSIQKESQMRCVIHTSTLPYEVSSKLNTNSMGTGQLPLSELLSDFPEADVLLRSRVNTKADGTPREINPREGVPLEAYLLYDLIIKIPEGEYKAVGRCYDWQETMFKVGEYDFNDGNTPVYSLEEEFDPFSARLNDSWRIPFGMDLEEREIRDRNGDRVPSVDVGINSSLMYKEEYKGGGSFEFGPTISHPFLQGLSGPGDITNMDNLNLDYRDTTITIGGHIKF